MSNVADYRTRAGISSRKAGETTLDKYLRVRRSPEFRKSLKDSLPLARPQIVCTLSADDYLLLLEVLDELFVLEEAARFADRKSSKVSQGRLYRALSRELGVPAKKLKSLFDKVDVSSLNALRQLATRILGDEATAQFPSPTSAGVRPSGGARFLQRRLSVFEPRKQRAAR